MVSLVNLIKDDPGIPVPEGSGWRLEEAAVIPISSPSGCVIPVVIKGRTSVFLQPLSGQYSLANLPRPGQKNHVSSYQRFVKGVYF
jgi:hypothetical protein